MKPGMIQKVGQWLMRVMTQPRHELDRWQSAVRFGYDLGRYGARQLQHDRAPQMAAALAFHTLFGMFPVLVVATVLVKALGAGTWFMDPLHNIFISLGLNEITVMLPGGGGSASQTLDLWLMNRVHEAERIDMATIGWVGLGVTAYAAIGLLVTIENSFNIVFRAPSGRPWTRRVPLYWFILTLSPVAIVLSTYLNGRFASWLASMDLWPVVSATGGILWSLTVNWIFMFAVYMLFPNTTVAARPVAIGALVAAILIEIGKQTLGAYLSNALSISQLYGSLGLIPLFVYWVYLMWLMVLFGLEVSATLQMLHGRQLEKVESRRRWRPLIDPAAVLSVMEVIGEGFHKARPTSPQDLAKATSIPEPVVTVMLDQLAQAGFVHRLEGEEHAVSLAQPPENMCADRLLEIGFELADQHETGRRSVLAPKLRQVQRDVASRSTLASLMATGVDPVK